MQPCDISSQAAILRHATLDVAAPHGDGGPRDCPEVSAQLLAGQSAQFAREIDGHVPFLISLAVPGKNAFRRNAVIRGHGRDDAAHIRPWLQMVQLRNVVLCRPVRQKRILHPVEKSLRAEDCAGSGFVEGIRRGGIRHIRRIAPPCDLCRPGEAAQDPVCLKPLRGRVRRDEVAATAPWIRPRPRHDAGPYGIAMDVARRCFQVRAGVDQKSFEAALEQMSRAGVAAIVVRGAADVEPVHGPAEIALRRLYQQVKVVRHQAIAVDENGVPLGHPAEVTEESLTVPPVCDDRLLPLTAVQNMIERTGIFNTQRPGHIETVPPCDQPCQCRTEELRRIGVES